jgi:hypothetical protein
MKSKTRIKEVQVNSRSGFAKSYRQSIVNQYTGQFRIGNGRTRVLAFYYNGKTTRNQGFKTLLKKLSGVLINTLENI